LAGDCRADWVVVDGYDFDAAYHRRMRQAGHALLVVDDYAHLPEYDADIVLNQNICANGFTYRLPPYTRRLFGLSYVMLRREFRRAREALGPFREEARRVLVTLGGGDDHDVTGLVLDALALVTGSRLVVDIVVGVAYDHRVMLERRLAESPHEARLHINTAEMPRLMQQADIAVSGAGSTCWELAALGVPMCLVTLAENQRAIAEHLGALGAAVALGWYHELSAARVAATVSGLLHNPELRQRLREVCLPLIDGRGCERIVSELRVQSPQGKP
jgi:UDP-2,4-diacetamido-2,4,6-trideoxy-beta-L-altropyranose hydrolase